MKYNTTNELDHFNFSEAYITAIQKRNGYIQLTLDNVTIMPDNSCNRDIREMRTNGLNLKILDGEVALLVQEGYKVYNPDGKLTGCTYLTLKGTYKYSSSHANGIKVEYRFYLGDNLTNNYNIQRDHHYDLTINIKGANSADLRVKITDGNVAVFDDVDTIENEVSF